MVFGRFFSGDNSTLANTTMIKLYNVHLNELTKLVCVPSSFAFPFWWSLFSADLTVVHTVISNYICRLSV